MAGAIAHDEAQHLRSAIGEVLRTSPELPAAVLAAFGRAPKVLPAVDAPGRVAFIRFIPEVETTSQVFSAYVTSATFQTLTKLGDDTWRVWGAGTVLRQQRTFSAPCRTPIIVKSRKSLRAADELWPLETLTSVAGPAFLRLTMPTSCVPVIRTRVTPVRIEFSAETSCRLLVDPVIVLRAGGAASTVAATATTVTELSGETWCAIRVAAPGAQSRQSV